MMLKDHPKTRRFTEAGELSQLTAWYEEGRNIMWMMLHATPRPCFNQALLDDIAQLAITAKLSHLPIDFWVTGSTVPGLYNVGGDLSFFSQHIRKGERAPLMKYAHSCIDAVHHAMTGFGVGAITIALVEGSALGGGLEAALAHDFMLAQHRVKMGFPEIDFNLFPGMGGYSLIARKHSPKLAEQLIMSGEPHTSEWFHQHDLVDQMFEPGQAYHATRTFIDTMRPRLNGTRAMIRARSRVFPLHKQELIDITNDWVDSAFNLSQQNLAYMDRLVTLQNRKRVRPFAQPVVAMPAANETPVVEAIPAAPNLTSYMQQVR
jgi:DSF synthase